MDLMHGIEPPTYVQDMMDNWLAWLDAFSTAFQRETGRVHYEFWPDLDSLLLSIYGRGDEPEEAVAMWARIYWAERVWTVPWMMAREGNAW